MYGSLCPDRTDLRPDTSTPRPGMSSGRLQKPGGVFSARWQRSSLGGIYSAFRARVCRPVGARGARGASRRPRRRRARGRRRAMAAAAPQEYRERGWSSIPISRASSCRRTSFDLACCSSCTRVPAHGYELRERLRPLGFNRDDPGRLYRALRALEDAELVRSAWQSSAGGPGPAHVRAYARGRRAPAGGRRRAAGDARRARPLPAALRRDGFGRRPASRAVRARLTRRAGAALDGTPR